MSSQPRIFHIEIHGRVRRVELRPGSSEGNFQATLDGNPIELQLQLLQPGILSLIIENRSYRCVYDPNSDPNAREPAVQVDGCSFPFRIQDPRSLSDRRSRAASTGSQLIKAPMPGRVVRLLVEPGTVVAAHQGIAVIEAMKMQNELKTARPGVVTEIRVAPGSTVTAGQVLAVIE